MDVTKNNLPIFNIGVLPIKGFALMSYASTVEPFRAANQLGGQMHYRIITISKEGQQIAGTSDVELEPLTNFEDVPALDLLLVVAGGDPIRFDDPQVFAFIRRMARITNTVGGVSGGPALLVRAGVMAGRRMTVHWEHAEGLLELVPDLLIERSLFVIDRDRMTCAGGTAPLDMAHALIAQHSGEVFAQLVSDWFLHTEVRASAAPQRSGLAPRIGTTNPAVLRAVVAMENNVSEPLKVEDLAVAAHLSARQLNRTFHNKLGVSVSQYYRRLRCAKAQNLLQNTAMNVAEVAEATGFSNAGHLAKAYRAEYGRPPSSARD